MAFVIPEAELQYRASRSSGPGGQHVNKASTRIEVIWNVRESAALSDEQREQILHALSNRIDRRGRIRVAASGSRSQVSNRIAATDRLERLVRAGLQPRTPRVKTKRPAVADEARLREKRERAEKKRDRRTPTRLDD
jgi:ribosome-associated protein